MELFLRNHSMFVADEIRENIEFARREPKSYSTCVSFEGLELEADGAGLQRTVDLTPTGARDLRGDHLASVLRNFAIVQYKRQWASSADEMRGFAALVAEPQTRVRGSSMNYGVPPSGACDETDVERLVSGVDGIAGKLIEVLRVGTRRPSSPRLCPVVEHAVAKVAPTNKTERYAPVVTNVRALRAEKIVFIVSSSLFNVGGIDRDHSPAICCRRAR